MILKRNTVACINGFTYHLHNTHVLFKTIRSFIMSATTSLPENFISSLFLRCYGIAFNLFSLTVDHCRCLPNNCANTPIKFAFITFKCCNTLSDCDCVRRVSLMFVKHAEVVFRCVLSFVLIRIFFLIFLLAGQKINCHCYILGYIYIIIFSGRL